MNSKGKKVLTMVTAMGLALSIAMISPVETVFASTTVPVTRFGGATRYATSASLATANWKKSTNAVLVSGYNVYDAISATVLANKLGAPLLLTSSNSIDTDTATALSTLGVKNVYIVGNSNSISQSVRDSIKASYILIEIYGADKYATNVAVANYLVNTLGVSASKVLVAGGEAWPDALSVASIAAVNSEILLLANNDETEMTATNKFVKDNNSAVTLIGTSNIVGKTEQTALNNATRVDGGTDRFATNLIVNKAFATNLNADTTYVVNAAGEGFVDALVAASAAGATKSPLILLDTQDSQGTVNALDYIKTLSPKTQVTIVGGTGVVTDFTLTNVSNVINGLPIIVAEDDPPYDPYAWVTELGEQINYLGYDISFVQVVPNSGKYIMSINIGNLSKDLVYSQQILDSLSIDGVRPISIKEFTDGQTLCRRYSVEFRRELPSSMDGFKVKIKGIYFNSDITKKENLNSTNEVTSEIRYAVQGEEYTVPTTPYIDTLENEIYNLGESMSFDKFSKTSGYCEMTFYTKTIDPNLVYNEQILNSLTINGVKPISIKVIPNSYRSSVKYAIQFGDSFPKSDFKVSVKGLYFKSDSSVKKDLNTDGSALDFYEPNRPYTLDDSIINLNMSFDQIEPNSGKYIMSIYLDTVDVNLEYDKQILDSLSIDGVKPISIQEINDTSEDYRRYSVEFETQLPETEFKIGVKGLYLKSDPTVKEDMSITDYAVRYGHSHGRDGL